MGREHEKLREQGYDEETGLLAEWDAAQSRIQHLEKVLRTLSGVVRNLEGKEIDYRVAVPLAHALGLAEAILNDG